MKGTLDLGMFLLIFKGRSSKIDPWVAGGWAPRQAFKKVKRTLQDFRRSFALVSRTLKEYLRHMG